MYIIQKETKKNHLMLNRKPRLKTRILPIFYLYQTYDSKSQVYSLLLWSRTNLSD